MGVLGFKTGAHYLFNTGYVILSHVFQTTPSKTNRVLLIVPTESSLAARGPASFQGWHANVAKTVSNVHYRKSRPPYKSWLILLNKCNERFTCYIVAYAGVQTSLVNVQLVFLLLH